MNRGRSEMRTEGRLEHLEMREAFAKCGHTRENIIQLVLTEKGWEGTDSFE